MSGRGKRAAVGTEGQTLTVLCSGPLGAQLWVASRWRPSFRPRAERLPCPLEPISGWLVRTGVGSRGAWGEMRRVGLGSSGHLRSPGSPRTRVSCQFAHCIVSGCLSGTWAFQVLPRSHMPGALACPHRCSAKGGKKKNDPRCPGNCKDARSWATGGNGLPQGPVERSRGFRSRSGLFPH